MSEQLKPETLAALRSRYTPTAIPPCPVCAKPRGFASIGGGNAPVVACDYARNENGSMDWEHYEKSRDTFYGTGDSDVIAVVDAYENRRTEHAATVPDVLFDGFAVYSALDEKAKSRTSPENVSDTLDAIVRILRARQPAPATDADRRDAERYRWLRNSSLKTGIEAPAVVMADEFASNVEGELLSYHRLDAAIDAALAKGEVTE
jgi:hypothetical protein